MYRLAWFLAGAVFSYIASGYVEGWLEDEENKEDKPEGRV
jgi:hypothetical protein